VADDLEMAGMDITIRRLNVFNILTAIVNDPAALGLVDAENSCINPRQVKGAVCAHPDQFLFWDGVHPTRVGHEQLANEAGAILTAP
jgi:phospholipase/lecithinase/hemolysin